jgi:nucleoid-associated protein YgaU
MPHFSDNSMKNFSTVGARIAGAALLAGVFAIPAQAHTRCEFRANAPDQHVVVKRDTLWDISGKFLEKPWCWPKVWNMNRDQIKNPHWIYPGQIIYFDRANGRLTLVKPGMGDDGVTRISPQMRTEGMDAAGIDSIPAHVIEPFLTQPLIVDENTLNTAPTIVSSREGRVSMGKDDIAYVRGNIGADTNFQVFRPGKPLTDPDTGKIAGYEAVYLGTAVLKAAAKPGIDVHTFTIMTSKMEMSVGDRMLPTPPMPLRNYVPHEPERNVHARVMSVYSGVTHAGQNQVVSVNRGAVDGLDVGAVLQLYHKGHMVKDPNARPKIFGKQETLQLPDEFSGDLFIFRVFNKISYGLIMQVNQPVVVGDVAKSPE